MNAPFIWIIAPALAAGVLLLVPLRPRWQKLLGGSMAALFSLLAAFLRIDDVQVVGPWAYRIAAEWVVAGRQFIIGDAERPQLILLYGLLAFWLLSSTAVSVPRLFAPLGLATVAVFVAALSVNPILFAPLLILGGVLLLVVMLTPPGERVKRGVMRLLAYQTLAMPLLLMAGWLVSGVESETLSIADLPIPLFLGVGLVFLLGVFPFHSWIPMLLDEGNPYTATFAVTVLMQVSILFMMEFFGRYTALAPLLDIEDVLRFGGILMWVFAGVWAAFQRHLGRMLGFALLAELGRMILWLSLTEGQTVVLLSAIPRALSLGVWALALTLLQARVPGLRFSEVVGGARRYPALAAGLLFAHASLAGAPLLAGFPVLWVLIQRLAGFGSWLPIAGILGSAGLLVGAVRSLAVLVMSREDAAAEAVADPPAWYRLVFVYAGMVLLFLMGIFPQWIWGWI